MSNRVVESSWQASPHSETLAECVQLRARCGPCRPSTSVIARRRSQAAIEVCFQAATIVVLRFLRRRVNNRDIHSVRFNACTSGVFPVSDCSSISTT